MNANRTIAVLCALCALSALPTHARVFDVRHVGDDSSSTASPSTNPTSPSPTSPASTSPTTSPAGPTASTPTPAHPYCQTCQVVGEQRYQLIRGDDEVQQCTDHYYCDCLEHKQLQCTGLMSVWESFNPDKQACALGFSCSKWLGDNPTTTAAPASTTPTSGSTTVQSTTTSPPASNPTTRSPTTKSPPMTQSTASKAPNPSTTPGTTAKPSSAWANRATALTVVCLAALAAL